MLVRLFIVGAIWLALWATPAILPARSDEAVAGTVSLSRLIPSDVLAGFEQADPGVSAMACPAQRGVRSLPGFRPYDKLTGLSSSMANGDGVLSYYNLYKFAGLMSELVTDAHVRRNAEVKTVLIKKFAEWAEAGAYLKTRDCSDGNCPEQWQTKRGTDLSPLKDSEQAVNHVMDLALAYYPFLSTHNREGLAAEHVAIDKWMRTFSRRLLFNWANAPVSKQIRGIYDLQPHRSKLLFDLVKGDSKSFRLRLQSSVKGMSAQIREDGSIRNATVRGSKALWYHFWTLDDVFWQLEVLKANDMDAYAKFEKRLERAVKIFLDGMDDPSTIHKWAKADYHSAGDPRMQDFDMNRFAYNDSGQSWLYVYLYRYPQTENARRLRSLLSRRVVRHIMDFKLGANIGCLYRVAEPNLLTGPT